MFDTIHHFQQLSSCVGTNSCGVGVLPVADDVAERGAVGGARGRGGEAINDAA